MITVSDVAALRELVRQARSSGKTVGFVPTMGALHEGHLSLLRLAKRETGFVVVSIFVNPLQFTPSEDFARYPRRSEEDAALLEREGVDLLYLPDPERFYPPGFSTSVEVAGISEGGEGTVRPGHFRGVATVVARLFHQVLPDIAFFGRKDLQQTAVIRRMVRDLDLPVRIAIGETVREADGLALSSRNAYLAREERARASLLSRALFAARERAAAGERDAASLARMAKAELDRAGFRVDYVEVVDPDTMQPLGRVVPGTAMAAAVRLGNTRLIDNVVLLDE
jgi:pantoate--beta-alanine ligase